MATITLAEEKSLSLRLKNGDYAAFTTLYNQYGRIVYANLLKLTKSPETSEDFLQDIFLKLWQNRENIDPDKSIKGYLVTVSYNLFKNSLRTLKLEEQVEAFIAYSQKDLHEDVEEKLFFKETDALLGSIIDMLPPKRKEVYHLCQVEGLSYEQAASTLGVSPGTIHDHISKANKFIRQQLVTGGATELSGLLLFSLFFV